MQPASILLGRRFQVWLFDVSHCQLLIRSTKDETHPTRIDLYFKAVLAMNLPTVFDVMRIDVVEASGDDKSILVGAWPSINHEDTFRNRMVYRFFGGPDVPYVVAGYFARHEDSGEYFEPSAFASNFRHGLA